MNTADTARTGKRAAGSKMGTAGAPFAEWEPCRQREPRQGAATVPACTEWQRARKRARKHKYQRY